MIQNCLSANPYGICTKCIEGYNIKNINGNIKCIKVWPNCADVNPNTNICTKCNNGHYLNIQNLCVVLPTNCQLAD